MLKFTQTDTEHGNCWQTAIACILRVDPHEMPSQVALESGGCSFHNALQEYLVRHHRLMYFELFEWQYGGLRVAGDGYHLLAGPTVRTPTNGRTHVVVARHGEYIWDPHPSRAGLTGVDVKWGILSPTPQSMLDLRARCKEQRPDDYRCYCRACGGE